MATVWDILTDPVRLATVRAWALTSIPPYPATSAQLRDAASLVAFVAPDDWRISPYPDGLRVAEVSCVAHFLSLHGLAEDVPVYGVALLAGDDQVLVDYYPPGFLIGPDHPKLAWPIDVFVVDGRDA